MVGWGGFGGGGEGGGGDGARPGGAGWGGVNVSVEEGNGRVAAGGGGMDVLLMVAWATLRMLSSHQSPKAEHNCWLIRAALVTIRRQGTVVDQPEDAPLGEMSWPHGGSWGRLDLALAMAFSRNLQRQLGAQTAPPVSARGHHGATPSMSERRYAIFTQKRRWDGLGRAGIEHGIGMTMGGDWNDSSPRKVDARARHFMPAPDVATEEHR